MVSFAEILPIFLRAFISFVLLLLLAKLMGAKQISQMTFFDYIVGISIGSIAAVLAIDDQIPAVYPIAAMVIYALLDLALSVITNKSIVARRFFTGTPSIIIDNGKIIRENMVHTHYDINDLLSLCRTKGFYNVSDISYAILETNGELSILPKTSHRPVTPGDLNLTPAEEGVLANVVIDGNIMHNNLKGIGRNEEWLKKKLEEQEIKKVEDILLATCDSTGNVSVFLKDEKPPHHGMFE